jgi:hypothetical protein
MRDGIQTFMDCPYRMGSQENLPEGYKNRSCNRFGAVGSCEDNLKNHTCKMGYAT